MLVPEFDLSISSSIFIGLLRNNVQTMIATQTYYVGQEKSLHVQSKKISLNTSM